MSGNEKIHDVKWHELNKIFDNLATGVTHKIVVQREAIPLIFVPGIMGSRLRHAGTGKMRWDPSSDLFMLKTYLRAKPETRKKLLIGDQFDPDFLEVDNSSPTGDGVQGISDSSYGDFIHRLRTHSWEPLDKLFDFPVYAFGYNWTDTNYNSGEKLAKRIENIIDECNKAKRPCRQVILISHSMGGLVCRSASELHGSRDRILGVIHGVQPVFGACSAYWRMKAGFEGWGPTSSVLGSDGKKVTAMLANMPGGLELLPTRHYRTNQGSRAWLRIFNKSGQEELALPHSDPYEEIYRERDAYWRLVDEKLLDLDIEGDNVNDIFRLNIGKKKKSPWDEYIESLKKAEDFHNKLGQKKHSNSFCFHGQGHITADEIRYKTKSIPYIAPWPHEIHRYNGGGRWFCENQYKTCGFRHVLPPKKNGGGVQSVLQEPSGAGDGTVSISSGGALDSGASKPPEPEVFNIKHEPAYKKNDDTFRFVRQTIAGLCQIKLEEYGL